MPFKPISFCTYPGILQKQIGLLCGTLTLFLLTGCQQDPPPARHVDLKTSARITAHILPSHVNDRKGWAEQIQTTLTTLNLSHSAQNQCSVIAIIDQESNFNASPTVPNLGKTARAELHERLKQKMGDVLATRFEQMLEEKPTLHDNFAKRLSKVQTEQQLDLLYREMFTYFNQHYNATLLTGAASLVAGHDLEEYLNPVKTLGSMQVHIQYAIDHPRAISNIHDMRDYLYTKEGGVYYGTHRLLMYPVHYDKALYRFADYNSGIYSSRNAAFQNIIKTLTAIPLVLDGDLLSYDKDKNALAPQGSSEKAIHTLFKQAGVMLTDAQIRKDLLLEKTVDFEHTPTYLAVEKLYKTTQGKNAPYAIMPQVEITGPKIKHEHATNWYATNVNNRYLKCMERAKNEGLLD